MDPIFARNAQNRFGFWGSAPDPRCGSLYTTLPRPLVVIAASLFRHSQFNLLACSHKHLSFYISSFFPPGSRALLNSVELTNYGYFCILCTHPIYVFGPSVISEYRPISVVSILSRIVERIIVNSYIYPAFLKPPVVENIKDQFAFRPTGSTTAAVIDLLQQTTTMLLTNDFVF